MKARLLLPLLVCWPCYMVPGQDYPRQDLDLNHLADELYGFPDQDMAYEDLYENMLQLLSNPMDLNQAKDEDLRFLNILSAEQIKQLLDYRKKFHPFLSVYELQAVPGFDVLTIARLAPFVKVVDPGERFTIDYMKKLGEETSHYILVRYERTLSSKKGYDGSVTPDRQFLGSPDKWYIRYRSSRPGDFSIGFTAEKDAGEPLQWSPAQRYYGVDYLSFHAQLQHKGRLTNLIVGDYQCQFGQGLMFGGMMGMGKGSETITTARKSNVGVLPYTSVYEAGSLRGISATLEPARNFFVTTFFSRVKKDASVAEDTTQESYASSFQTTGLHRNERELLPRKNITDTHWGSVFQYKVNQFDVGLMYDHVLFDTPIHPRRTPYNQFAFEGDENINFGAFLNYNYRNISFFSEVSRTHQAGNALIAGLLISLTERLDISWLYRRLEGNFHSFYSNAFAENTTTQNETGIYWGWKYRLARKVSAAGYLDLFRFPWLRYRSYAPSTGHEWLFRLTFQPSRHHQFFVQGREESKTKNISTPPNAALYQTAMGTKRNFLIGASYGLRQNLTWKTRAQFSTFQFNGVTTHGFALIQDIQGRVGKFTVTTRFCLFDTEDYDNRQYAYENDVYLAYTMPAYAGVGIRQVFLVAYKVNKTISLWMRYAHTRYLHADTIGTGLETIAGNIKNDVKFQVRFKW